MSAFGGMPGAPTPAQGSFWDMTPEQQGMYSANLIMGTMQSCPGKSVMAGVTGFGLGGVFGLFMASVSTTEVSASRVSASAETRVVLDVWLDGINMN